MNDHERKTMLRDTFNMIAGGYDGDALRFFPETARHLPGYLELKGDEHVLDAATGTGYAALALAGCLPRGRVTGIDFSENMLAQAKAKAEALQIANVRFLPMDMQALDFADGYFDAAVCAFGIFFVPDMAAQLRHLVSKVRPGGRVLITSFHDRTFHPLASLFGERLKKFGVDVQRELRRRLATETECLSLFESAGLGGIRVDRKDIGYFLRDGGQWWDIVWNAGYRRFVNLLSPADRERFRKEHLREVETLAAKDGIRLEVDILFTSGIVA